MKGRAGAVLRRVPVWGQLQSLDAKLIYLEVALVSVHNQGRLLVELLLKLNDQGINGWLKSRWLCIKQYPSIAL